MEPGIPHTSIWEEHGRVLYIDQRRLPFIVHIASLDTFQDAVRAIREMEVRGAPLIGVTAAYGMWRKCQELGDVHEFSAIIDAGEILKACRPTAVNLAWAVDRIIRTLREVPAPRRAAAAHDAAAAIRSEDIEQCRAIGQHGMQLIRRLHERNPERPVRILTHCNAGFLACVRYGTATAPMYAAHAAGIPIEVWVDETRPRNQGASLTTWELQQAGIPYYLLTDNAGGLLMQQGLVDLVITGSDRTARNGDVCNKIGTYLKALAAFDNKIPFYAALPSSTFDLSLSSGVGSIEIEYRDEQEVACVSGLDELSGELRTVRIAPPDTMCHNPGFDITPARLVSGLITERGICTASEPGILSLFPEYAG